MIAHCDALYVQDEGLALVCVNDWLERPAPAFWMGVARNGITWRFRKDVPMQIRGELERLIGEESPDSAKRWPDHHESYCFLLGEGDAVAGPTYSLSVLPARPDHSVRRVYPGDAAILRGTELEAWIPDIPHQQPMFASLEGGRAAAVCASVRTTSVAHEAGVETRPDCRRRGHAAAAVAAWASELLDSGLVPLYSTSWENVASQRVAQRLGFEAFGWEYRVG